jgi:ribonuclease Z
MVVLLGTGTPFPDPRAQGPATAVVVGDRVFLFDAGPGVLRQMRAAGLPIAGPEAAFITHLHSDHTVGLPDLIIHTWVMRRRRAFPLIGPPGLARMVGHIVAAWAEDIRIRTEGLEREMPDAWRVDVREVGPGVVYDTGGVRVTAIAVEHGDWPLAYGYRVDTADRAIVISGDARPSPGLEAAARGVDVLVHEVYPASRVAPEDRPGGEHWPEYLRRFHTSDRELGALAARARPRLLVLHHVVRMGASDAELLAGIRAGGFTGPVVVGRDLSRY